MNLGKRWEIYDSFYIHHTGNSDPKAENSISVKSDRKFLLTDHPKMFFSPNPNLLVDAQLCLLIHFSFLTPRKKSARTESQMKELDTASYVSFGYSPLTSQ